MSYATDRVSFDDRQEQAVAKARSCTSTAEFIKHCHTLIHLCSEALVKFEDQAKENGCNYDAQDVYQCLQELLSTTTLSFEYE